MFIKFIIPNVTLRIKKSVKIVIKRTFNTVCHMGVSCTGELSSKYARAKSSGVPKCSYSFSTSVIPECAAVSRSALTISLRSLYEHGNFFQTCLQYIRQALFNVVLCIVLPLKDLKQTICHSPVFPGQVRKIRLTRRFQMIVNSGHAFSHQNPLI